jgi:hypothetical protein
MFSEGNAARPVQFDSLLQIVMSVWRPLYKFEHPGSGVTAHAAENYSCVARFKLKKIVPNGHCYLLWAVTPDQITHQYSLQLAGVHLKVHKRENFLGSDFEICIL